MKNDLTDRELWVRYWNNYNYTSLSTKPVYAEYIPSLKENAKFIEIGGFPGLNAAYFYRNICCDVTILDFYIDKKIINNIEERNNIPINTIKSIEADFFSFNCQQKYNIVFSLGFIEHFEDTKDVIKHHVDMLEPEGTLLLLLPNLRGLNGLIQFLFDKENLAIHNLKSMNLEFLEKTITELGLKECKVEYTRKPMVWLEPKPTLKNKFGRFFTKMLSYILKLFPIKSRLLSPYIVVRAVK